MSKKILISGANGYIAGHTIGLLLAQGHQVVGTVRDKNNVEKIAHVQALPGADTGLTLVSADLNSAAPFDGLVDVDVIMHMASPYSLSVKDPQRDLVDPAINGTLSMLRAAMQSSTVKRVIITSSMAAVTDAPNGTVLTEDDWNTQSNLKRNPYYYSKTQAERAAWDFMAKEQPHFDLVVINPFMVIGPSLTAAINPSVQVLADIVKGKFPAIVALDFGMVDVRDVAAAHVAAMETLSASGRYVCAAETRSMKEVVALVRTLPVPQKRIPKLELDGSLGTTLMRGASYLQPGQIGPYLRSHLGGKIRFDHRKIERDLGVHFRPVEVSIKETLANLQHWGHIGSF